MCLGVQVLPDFHVVLIVSAVKLQDSAAQGGIAVERAQDNGLLLCCLGNVNFFQQGQFTAPG